MDITTNLALSDAEVDHLILDRTKDKLVQTFVLPEDLRDISNYKKFEESDERNQFRHSLLHTLEEAWKGLYGEARARKYRKKFQKIVGHLDQNGAIIFGALLNNDDFKCFLEQYTAIMNSAGSRSWLHSFVNLANFHEFINSMQFNAPFLHPLLVSLIAYQMGGMVRLADCRAKDVEPSSFLGSDSRLHIDGTPFEERYHILLSWEKDTIKGPHGQNFTFIPGTHKGVRNCFVNSRNEAWTSENGNIFITEERVAQIFDLQKKVLKQENPLVVEASYPAKPLTVLFDAASLAHHRYRNSTGCARSSIAIAFRRTNLKEKFSFLLPTKTPSTTRLNHFLFEDCTDKTDKDFVNSLAEHAIDIARMIERLDEPEDSAKIIEHHHLVQMTPSSIETWKKIITEAPDIEQTKKNAHYLPLNREMPQEAFIDMLVNMIMLDKHGTLDLIFYNDNHEQIRQASRIKIREKKQDQIAAILQHWKEAIEQPSSHHLLSPKKLQEIALRLVEKAIFWIESGKLQQESLPQCHSLIQFLLDLGEAITRADHRQTFLTTCLFLFLANDELLRLFNDSEFTQTGQQLLANYIATAILLERQIHE